MRVVTCVAATSGVLRPSVRCPTMLRCLLAVIFACLMGCTPSTSQSLHGLRTRGLALLDMQLLSACKFDGVLGFLMRYALCSIQCLGVCSCLRHLLRRHAKTTRRSAFSVLLAAICRAFVARVPGRIVWCNASLNRSFTLDRVAA